MYVKLFFPVSTLINLIIQALISVDTLRLIRRAAALKLNVLFRAEKIEIFFV